MAVPMLSGANRSAKLLPSSSRRVIAEQRLRAAVDDTMRAARSSTITPSVAVSRIALSSSVCARAASSAAWPAVAPALRRHGQQRERRLAVPRHLQQPRFGDGALVALARDRERLGGRRPRWRCRRTRPSGCRARRLPPAHPGCRSRPSPGTPVGVEQLARAGRPARRSASRSRNGRASGPRSPVRRRAARRQPAHPAAAAGDVRCSRRAAPARRASLMRPVSWRESS